ncbi:UDP-GlcNAc:betaGal beta-1,3-N-acetylglucosaminyltransferase 7-like [Apteryx mantelli]|uniref:Hexosyltransferase n=1 Tax=Apteryx mantelli TaxID=2696672 RepID=A0A8B7IMS3_9AVES
MSSWSAARPRWWRPNAGLSLACLLLLLLALLALRGPRAPGAHHGAAGPPAATWGVAQSRCGQRRAPGAPGWQQRVDGRFHAFLLHRHCRYFPLLLNHPEKCQGGRVALLIVVKSAAPHFARRAAVRRTWGREQEAPRRVRTLFLLGAAGQGEEARAVQRLLEEEDRAHGDVLQWDFLDTFHNLTLKEVNFLRWLHIYCPAADFVFKGDDDVFVHTANVLDFLESRRGHRDLSSLFVGDIISRAFPIRSPRSKYYIPRELYDGPYPPYAGGGGFLMASPLAHRLFLASERIPLFPIDDVFLGMCLRSLGVVPEPHLGFRTFGITRRRGSAMNRDPCFYKSLLMVHKLEPDALLAMWDLVQDDRIVCAKTLHLA